MRPAGSNHDFSSCPFHRMYQQHQAVKRLGLDPGARLILDEMIDELAGNESGEFRLSDAALSQRTGMSESTIGRAKARLLAVRHNGQHLVRIAKRGHHLAMKGVTIRDSTHYQLGRPLLHINADRQNEG